MPENWVNTYNQWMNNIQDWCISRQLWWGHQIPAWYDEDGNVYVAQERGSRRRPRHRARRCTRDEDVLDTWYSVGPGALLHARAGPRRRKDLDLYLPSTVLVTGYDIIFFWVARMIMMTTHFTGQVPVQARLHPRPGARLARQEDEQVRRQRARSGGPDRRHRAARTARQAHHRACASPRPHPPCARTRRRNSRTASRPSAPTRCASPSRRSPRWAAASTSTPSAARATATSATSSGTRPASC